MEGKHLCRKQEISGSNSRTGTQQRGSKKKRRVPPVDLEPARPISLFHIPSFPFLPLCPLFFLAAFYSIYPSLPGLLSLGFVFLSHFILATFPSLSLFYLSLLLSVLFITPSVSSGLHFNLLMFLTRCLLVLSFRTSASFRKRERDRGRVTFINNEASLARQVRHSLTLR